PTSHMSINLGTGSGHFGSATTYVAPNYVGSMAVADVDHDGALDIAVGGSTGTVDVYLGHKTSGIADGTFAAPTAYSLCGGSSCYLWGASAGDIAHQIGSGGYGNYPDFVFAPVIGYSQAFVMQNNGS